MLEPSGAVSLAALLFHRDELPRGPGRGRAQRRQRRPGALRRVAAAADDLIASASARSIIGDVDRPDPQLHAARSGAHRRPRQRARRQARCAVPVTCCRAAGATCRGGLPASTRSRSCSCPPHRPASTRQMLAVDGTVSADDPAELIALVVRERRAMTADGAAGRACLRRPDADWHGLVALPLVAADEAGGEDAEGVLLAAFDGRAPDPTAPRTCSPRWPTCARLPSARPASRARCWRRADWIGRLANTDPLTGLANKVTFERMLELEIARATRQETQLSVLLFDIDGFAEINERAGAAGRRRGAAPRRGDARRPGSAGRHGRALRPRRVRADRPGRRRRDRRAARARRARQARGRRASRSASASARWSTRRRREQRGAACRRAGARWPRPSVAAAARSSPLAGPRPSSASRTGRPPRPRHARATSSGDPCTVDDAPSLRLGRGQLEVALPDSLVEGRAVSSRPSRSGSCPSPRPSAGGSGPRPLARRSAPFDVGARPPVASSVNAAQRRRAAAPPP